MTSQRVRGAARQGVLFVDSGYIRPDPYPLAVLAVAENITTAASSNWRARERARQALAHDLHRAATTDLAQTESLWSQVPTDGPVDELLSLRHASEVPSIHLSRAAAVLAVWGCIAEISSRRGQPGWTADALDRLIAIWSRELPDLAKASVLPLAASLPGLKKASAALKDLADDELARVTGRTYEFGLTTSWVFRSRGTAPQRLSHVWRAKQSGCFFTPEWVARHLARTAVTKDSLHVLDPAVGGAAFLVEAYLRFVKLGVGSPARRLYGVDFDGALSDLSAVLVAFLDASPLNGRLSSRPRFQKGDSLLASLDGAWPGPTWKAWFPEVMAAGGFDVVLMNPPYMQLKVNHSSLPARRDDSDEVEALRVRGVDQARDNARRLSESLRAHPDFRYAHGGVPDLPRFFVERALSVLRPGGRLACIVPSTFLADHRSKGVRRHLLTDHTLREVDLIPEDARLFTDVNQPTCLLVADKGHAPRARIRMRTGISSPGSLASSPSIMVSPTLLHAVDPEQLRVPSCEPEDWDILRLLHQHPRIADHEWVDNLRGELDLTQDRSFISQVSTGLPLVRGDQIERFTSTLKSEKPRWVRSSFLRESVSHRKLQHIERLRVVGRQCSYLKKARRLSFSLIEPAAVVANSCNYLVVRPDNAAELSKFLTGALNSAVMEWRFRLTSSTNHVGNYELDALPLPEPHPELVARVSALVDQLLTDPHDMAADRDLDEVWFDAYGLGSDARRRIRSIVPAALDIST